MIAGFEMPTEGKILIDGVDVISKTRTSGISAWCFRITPSSLI
jgi:ABC-type sugar transport system ATPase subunit